ncbi:MULTISPECIES: ketopantoate reductase family protein [Halorussus]|uniref:ketopantoate reductase family protein n=1 Tax=Halorussus TaxID=1070314 RepID=UPI000E2188B6|nr:MULTISPECIES: ketopantoate reductase family protein [Halorussus]NHN60658.1 ketopantoate reductase family protein [Halorussus sp. JP-T4]
MDVVVFGAGSLGSLVGGLLAREHAVTLVGRDPHVGTVRESGLRVGGEYDFTVRPDATTDGTGLAADLAVVTVKAFDTDAAARTLSTGAFDAALSLQNGMGNEEALAERLDCPILAGTATYGAVLREPGLVECTGRGEVVLGPREGGASEAADRVGRAFSTAGIQTTVADDMPRRLWEKLAVNAGINATTALARVENGALLDGPAREVAAEAARETAGVARAEGVELGGDEAVRAAELVAEATAANESSMRRDVAAGRRTEVEAINGYVVARADANAAAGTRDADDGPAGDRDVPVPVNRTLRNLLRAWEDGHVDGDPRD